MSGHTQYPALVDPVSNHQNQVDTVFGDDVNDVSAAVNAVQAIVGTGTVDQITNGKGSVKAMGQDFQTRIAALEGGNARLVTDALPTSGSLDTRDFTLSKAPLGIPQVRVHGIRSYLPIFGFNPSDVVYFSPTEAYIFDSASRIIRFDPVTKVGVVVAGRGNSANPPSVGPIPALQADIGAPWCGAYDPSRQCFYWMAGTGVVQEYNVVTGMISIIAGAYGQQGYAGDGGPAINAIFNQAYSLCSDYNGKLYIADYNNHRIRVIDLTTGIINTFAGTGNFNTTGDGGQANVADIQQPQGVFVNPSGHVFIATNYAIRRIDIGTGVITHVAGIYGDGISHGDGGDPLSAGLAIWVPCSFSVDASETLYIPELFNNTIRRASSPLGGNLIETIIGNGSASCPPIGVPTSPLGPVVNYISCARLTGLDAGIYLQYNCQALVVSWAAGTHELLAYNITAPAVVNEHFNMDPTPWAAPVAAQTADMMANSSDNPFTANRLDVATAGGGTAFGMVSEKVLRLFLFPFPNSPYDFTQIDTVFVTYYTQEP